MFLDLAAQGVLASDDNTAPTLTPPADVTVSAGSPLAPLAFSVGDLETAPAALEVSAASSYPRLLPAENISVARGGVERSLQIRPLADQAGRTTIFLTVSDGRLVTTRSFLFSVANADGVVPPPVVERPFPGRRGPPPKR